MAERDSEDFPKLSPSSTEQRNDPVDPETGQFLCGDLDIRIDRDGTWFYHGSPIGRKELVKLFAKVLQRDSAGEFWLSTPVEKGRVAVEDAPFVAVELTVETGDKGQRLKFRTNVDDIVIAGEEHPIRIETDPDSGQPSPYLHVRGNLEALINRPVFYQLVDLGEEESLNDEVIYGVRSDGVFFPIGRLEEDGGETR